MARNDSFMGPAQASLNAPLPAQPRRNTPGPGGAGRDATEGAGIESGLFIKEVFGAGEGEKILGKMLEQSGTPPWSQPPEFTGEGPKVMDTFGAGESHTIKNG